MGVTTTAALILRHRDERERDRSIVVLTPDHGLLKLRARGTKSSVSKLAGSLEPLTEVTLSFADGRIGGLIIGSVVIERFARLRSDLVGIVGATWLAELVEVITKPGQAIPELYAQIRQSFLQLGQQEDWPLGQRWLALDGMAFDVLRREGFVPAWDHCPRCGKNLTADQVAYDPLVGFIHQSEAKKDSLRISPEAISFLTAASRPGAERAVFSQVHALVEALILHITDRPLKSGPVLRRVFRTERLSTRTD